MTTEELYRSGLEAAMAAIRAGERFEPVVAALSADGRQLLPIPVLDIRQVRSYIRRAIHAEQAQGFIYLSDSYLKLADGTYRAILGVWGDRVAGIHGEAWRAQNHPHGVGFDCIPAPDEILAPYASLFVHGLATLTDYRLTAPPPVR